MPDFKVTKKEVHTIIFTSEIEAESKQAAEKMIEENNGAAMDWRATGGGNSISVSIRKMKEKQND